MFAANGYYPTRTDYYPPMIDSCVIMPEVPPFPFNSAGTLYMYPPTSVTTVSILNDLNNENEHDDNDENENVINSSVSPSKDSNDTSVIESISTTNDENLSSTKKSLIADTPLTLVTSDDLQIKNVEEDKNDQIEE